MIIVRSSPLSRWLVSFRVRRSMWREREYSDIKRGRTGTEFGGDLLTCGEVDDMKHMAQRWKVPHV